VSSEELERRTIRRVGWRVVPLMALVFLTGHLDRVNIGFAALRMNEDLGFSNTVFGTGAGFFALGYVLAAIPSALMLHRIGARRWIAIMMLAWGLCSAATAFVTTPSQLLFVRALLGAAEAGFAPGAIYFFSRWFPGEYRGRVLGAFLLINPLAFVVGGPVSAALLTWDGIGQLAGWQWLFLIEALPTIPLALIVLRYLDSGPHEAQWLRIEERVWLESRLEAEARASHADRENGALRQVIRLPRVWHLCALSLAFSTAGVGIMFFLPLIVRATGFSQSVTGWVVTLPAIVGGLSLPLWGRWTDRAISREYVVAAACAMLAFGLACAALTLPSHWAILALCIAMAGYNGCVVAFWPLAPAFLVGALAAAGIAVINVVGNLGIFFGPALLGWMTDRTGSHASGLACLSLAATVAVILALQARKESAP
jgi:MFS family permease